MDNLTPNRKAPMAATPVEKLVTVEVQKEFNLLEGTTETQVFVKMYLAARTSGLLAAISDRDWKTLCVLATYMDEQGFCYPSQTELAKALGVSRQMANERIQSLAQFRFEGQPVVLIEKANRDTHGRWNRNGYRVLAICNLGIFDGREDGQGTRKKREKIGKNAAGKNSTVSSRLDTVDAAVSSGTVTVQLDTNKNQLINQKQIDDDYAPAIFSELLSERGIEAQAAARLAQQYPAHHIREKIELLDYLVETRSPLVARNPAGFLRKAIEADYPLPTGFRRRAERRQALEDQAHKRGAWETQTRASEAPPRQSVRPELAEPWRQVQEIMGQQSPQSLFQTYLKPTVLLEVRDGVAVIGTPNEMAIGWLGGRLSPIVRRALAAVFQAPLEVEFVTLPSGGGDDGQA